jgi:hypothetical protein
MQNGIAVAESCVSVLWYWKPKSAIKMQKYYHLKRKDSQLRTGLAMSCNMRAENSADNCAGYAPSLFQLAGT